MLHKKYADIAQWPAMHIIVFDPSSSPRNQVQQKRADHRIGAEAAQVTILPLKLIVGSPFVYADRWIAARQLVVPEIQHPGFGDGFACGNTRRTCF